MRLSLPSPECKKKHNYKVIYVIKCLLIGDDDDKSSYGMFE